MCLAQCRLAGGLCDTVIAGNRGVRLEQGFAVLFDAGDRDGDDLKVDLSMSSQAESTAIDSGDGDDVVLAGGGEDFVNVDRDSGENLGADSGEDVSLVIMTHVTAEGRIQAALDEVDQLDSVTSKSVRMRVLD